MTSVFLSYARRDDDEFVARVYAHLRANGFDVWWDKRNMPARSLAFTEEIRDAIHRRDRLVVVIGPRALTSDYVRAEWQAALSERKPVVTILRRVPDGTAGAHSCLPPELRPFHAEDLRVVDGGEPPLDALVRLLNGPIPAPPPIFGRPPERPPHFLPRPDLFSAIFGAVLGETTGPRVRTHEHRVTVLTGMGGIGKTVLAASLVEAMRSRPTTFLEDGIYWLAGEPLRRLAALCHARVGDLRDVHAVTDAVAGQLEGRRFLLVVDDATSVEQIAPLVRVLGPGGRMLVTTRHGELAVGHQHIEVDKLTPDAALQLVADWLSEPVDALPPQAQQVVKLCGFHPFAIALNAAAASQGLPWSAIVTALERRELGFAAHRFEEYIYATVEASLEISLNALSKPDRARYLELAAFFWEGGVPSAAILRLWHRRGRVPEHRGQQLLVFFRQRSLLQLHASGERRDVRLHDLHLAHIGRDANKVRRLSAALLDSYRPAKRDAWWGVEDDGYIRRHLVRHLFHARPATDVLALMSAEDDERRNAWYCARVHRAGAPVGSVADSADAGDDGFDGYVADLQLASDRIDDCLLVFIAASLRSIARAVPGELLGAAVGGEQWSLKRAIAHARLIADPEQQARARIALLPKVEDRETWLDETLEAIGKSEANRRQDLVGALAPALVPTELLPVLRRMVALAKEASTPFEETHTRPLVHPVLHRVPAPLVPEAVRIVDAIRIRPAYLYGLLPEPERSARIEEALDAWRDHPRDMSVALRARTVSQVAKHIDRARAEGLVRDALAEVQALEPDFPRHQGLLDLLPCLELDEQRRVLDELIADARKEPQQFLELARKAPPPLHSKIREALEDQTLTWIAQAAPAFTGPDRGALVDRALTQIEAQRNAASLLWMDEAELILAMNDRQLDRARHVIDAQLDGKARVRALTAVAQTGPASHRERTLDDVLAAIDALPETDNREQAYRTVAPLLGQRQLATALVAAQRIGEPSAVEQVAKMLPYLSATVRRRAIELVADRARTTTLRSCVDALRAIPSGFEVDGLERLTRLAQEPGEREGGAQLLAVLATRVGKPFRARVTAAARAAIGRCPPGRARIAPLLELGDVGEAEKELNLTAAGLDADALAALVAKIAPELPAERVAYWVDLTLERGSQGKQVLERIAPFLAADQAVGYLARRIVPADAMDRGPLLQVMAKTRGLPFVHEDLAAYAAGALAQRLGALGRADEAFALVRVGRDDGVTAMALLGLSPWLSRDELLRVEQRVLSAQLGFVYVPTLYGRRSVGSSFLTGRLAPALARSGELSRALQYATMAEEESRVHALLGIAQMVSGQARSSALVATIDALLQMRDVHRNDWIDAVGQAVSASRQAASPAWVAAAAWARAQQRHEAVAVLAPLSPVAAAVGGTALVDEVFRGIERTLRWWP